MFVFDSLQVCKMSGIAGRLLLTLSAVLCVIVLQSQAAPHAAVGLSKSPNPFQIRRRTACEIVHFPPPNQHIYCCRLVDDCQCPRRMGLCAPDVVSQSSASTLSLLKRLLS